MFRHPPLVAALVAALIAAPAASEDLSYGDRPLALVEAMRDGPLKDRLRACAGQTVQRTDFSIAHRGAPLRYPEHTAEGYRAAAAMGAGIVECDVTFTKDRVLVCRHAEDDLAESTDIVATPLAATCAEPFRPADGVRPATATCRTSDLTLAEFRTLKGAMEGADKRAETAAAFIEGAPGWRGGEGYPRRGTLVTHAESIALFQKLGVKFAPELKAQSPGAGRNWPREAAAQALVDEYKAAGVPPEDVWLQSFDIDDLRYWIEAEPAFARQAVYLDGRYRGGLDPMRPTTFQPTMPALKAMGVNYIAPPLWMLLSVEDGRIVASAYADEANAAGLNIIAWTLERSGPLAGGGGWYFRSIRDAIYGDGAVFDALHALATEADVVGVFSDWPATTTYYANCMGLK